MKTLITLFLLPFILLTLASSYDEAGYQEDQSCVNTIKDIYKNINLTAPADVNTYCYFSYTKKITLHKEFSAKNRIYSTKVNLIAGKTRSRFLSKEMSVYQDEKYTFTVLPAQKMITWSDSNGKLMEKYNKERLELMHEELLKQCYVEECISVKNSQESIDKKIVLIPSSKAKQLYEVGKLTYYINEREHLIKKVKIDYSESNKRIESAELTFDNLEYRSNVKELKQPVADLFVDSKGRLLKPYAGYQLIDVRKRKK